MVNMQQKNEKKEMPMLQKKKNKKENEKSPQKKRKKRKKKPMTRNERIMYTIILVISIPLGVLFFVYYNSALMQTIILAKGLFKTEQNLGIPTDPDRVPYSKSMSHGATKDPSNTESVFDIMDKQNKKVSGVDPPKKQTGGRRKVQRGGNKFNTATNEAKAFLDPTKFGFPYTWYDNDNIVMKGISNYFVTFWTFMRGGLVKLLDICNESFYKEGYQGYPTDLGGQVFDFVKFSMILPLISVIIYAGNICLGTVGLFWSSISNQTLLILFWLIMGILSLVIGTITTIAVAGVTVSYLNIFVAIAFTMLTIAVCYFWPYGFFWFYLQAMILKMDESKKKLFRNYLKNYELCWILSILSLLGVTISYIWEWHIIPLVAFGGVGGTFILLRAMGLI